MSLLIDYAKAMFLEWPVPRGQWGVQYTVVDTNQTMYHNMKERLTEHWLQDHFDGRVPFQLPKRIDGKIVIGSLAVKPTYAEPGASEGPEAKWLCIDCDDIRAVELAHSKLIPFLEQEEISYIWEFGGLDEERCHVWIHHELTSTAIARVFALALFNAVGINVLNRNPEFELYPAMKPNNLIRLPFGLHSKAGVVHQARFGQERITTAKHYMRVVVNMQPLPVTKMLDIVSKHSRHIPEDTLDADREHGSYFVKKKQKKVVLARLDLPVSLDTIVNAPEEFTTIVRECPAFNTLCTKIENEALLEETGDTIHRTGLALKSVFDYIIRRKKLVKQKLKAEEYRDWYFEEYRLRSHESHNWFRTDSANRVWHCNTMQKNFNACGGCPHRGRIDKPTDLIHNDFLKIVVLGEVKASTVEDIYKTVKIKSDNAIFRAINRDKKLCLFIRSVPGTKKSTYVTETTARLVREGHNVLIAVPTAQLAKEQQKRLRAHGVEAFLVMSHKNLFEHVADFQCPEAEEIQLQQEAGIRRHHIKKQFCNNCSFQDECPFPDQYTNVQETRKKVVIVQHALFSKRIAFDLVRKKDFSLMFVDETFLDSCYDYVKVTKAERALLGSAGFGWTEKLEDWLLEEGTPDEKGINPDKDELIGLRHLFVKNKLPWNVPFFIEQYNDHRLYDHKEGIFRFRPIPDFPITVFTDATLPKEIVEIILDKKGLTRSAGQKELINVKLYNPNNKIIKVIDASNSVTAMSDQERFRNILQFIAFKAQTEYQSEKILVTVYNKDILAVRKFFNDALPTECERIIVAGMAIGTNTWSDVNVQFQLAGVHFSDEILQKWEWKITNFHNYWALQNSLTRKNNLFPTLAHRYSEAFDYWHYEELQLNLLMPQGPRRVMLPQIKVKTPKTALGKMANDLALGITLQAKRLRVFIEERASSQAIRHTYDWSKRPQDAVLYTDLVFESALFAEAGIIETDEEEILETVG